MENGIRVLHSDMLVLLEISSEIGKYEQMYLQHNNLSDKYNYNEEKCLLIRKKLNSLYERYNIIYKTWF